MEEDRNEQEREKSRVGWEESRTVQSPKSSQNIWKVVQSGQRTEKEAGPPSQGQQGRVFPASHQRTTQGSPEAIAISTGGGRLERWLRVRRADGSCRGLGDHFL